MSAGTTEPFTCIRQEGSLGSSSSGGGLFDGRPKDSNLGRDALVFTADQPPQAKAVNKEKYRGYVEPASEDPAFGFTRMAARYIPAMSFWMCKSERLYKFSWNPRFPKFAAKFCTK